MTAPTTIAEAIALIEARRDRWDARYHATRNEFDRERALLGELECSAILTLLRGTSP